MVQLISNFMLVSTELRVSALFLLCTLLKLACSVTLLACSSLLIVTGLLASTRALTPESCIAKVRTSDSSLRVHMSSSRALFER